MSNLLIQTILAAGNSDGEETIWMQILILVILAGSFGVISLAKAKANKFKEQSKQNYPQKISSYKSKRLRQWQIQPSLGHSKSSPSISIAAGGSKKSRKSKQPMFDFPATAATVRTKPKRKLANKKEKDLQSGMELLELNFLLSVVENTDSKDEKDVIMRKLNFKELLRRGKLNEANSKALRIYAINEDNRYGKDIQCEAMKNLAERTAAVSK